MPVPNSLRLSPALRRALGRRESLVIRLTDDALGRSQYTVELEGVPLFGRAVELTDALAELEARLTQAEKLAGLEQLKRELAAFDPAKPTSVRRRALR